MNVAHLTIGLTFLIIGLNMYSGAILLIIFTKYKPKAAISWSFIIGSFLISIAVALLLN